MLEKVICNNNNNNNNNNIKFTTTALRSYPRFMQPEEALPCTQTPASGPCHMKVAPINSQGLTAVRQL
jgi:hypothetical protein